MPTYTNTYTSLDKIGLVYTLWLILFTHAAGTTLAFASIFGFPEVTFFSNALSFLCAIALWVFYTLFCLLPHYLFTRRFPSNILAPFVLPASYTMVSNVIIGHYLSTFLSIANSVADYGPLRQLASVFGLGAINFFVILLGTLLAFVYLDINRRNIRRLLKMNALVWIVVSLYCNYELIANRFWQKNIAALGTFLSIYIYIFRPLDS